MKFLEKQLAAWRVDPRHDSRREVLAAIHRTFGVKGLETFSRLTGEDWRHYYSPPRYRPGRRADTRRRWSRDVHRLALAARRVWF